MAEAHDAAPTRELVITRHQADLLMAGRARCEEIEHLLTAARRDLLATARGVTAGHGLPMARIVDLRDETPPVLVVDVSEGIAL